MRYVQPADLGDLLADLERRLQALETSPAAALNPLIQTATGASGPFTLTTQDQVIASTTFTVIRRRQVLVLIPFTVTLTGATGDPVCHTDLVITFQNDSGNTVTQRVGVGTVHQFGYTTLTGVQTALPLGGRTITAKVVAYSFGAPGGTQVGCENGQFYVFEMGG